MARKRRGNRRRGRNFVAIPYSVDLPLLTLASGAVVTGAGPTLGEDLFVISLEGTVSLRDAASGEGPLTFGYAHGDLSATEIAEAINSALTDPDDIIAKERSRRPVRRFGVLHPTDEVLDHGAAVRVPAKFSVGDGHFVAFWAQNRSGVNPLTTGAVLSFDGVIFGRWQR